MDKQLQFGERLRAIRKAKGWSQGQLADKSNLSVEGISNLERGLNYPSYNTLERFSAALGLPIKDFFEYEIADKDKSELLAALMIAARRLNKTDLAIAVQLVDRLDKK